MFFMPCPKKTLGEPSLEEILAEPIVRRLMARDRVDEPGLRRLAGEVRRRIETRAQGASAK
jgi:hypothetical protein